MTLSMCLHVTSAGNLSDVQRGCIMQHCLDAHVMQWAVQVPVEKRVSRATTSIFRFSNGLTIGSLTHTILLHEMVGGVALSSAAAHPCCMTEERIGSHPFIPGRAPLLSARLWTGPLLGLACRSSIRRWRSCVTACTCS